MKRLFVRRQRLFVLVSVTPETEVFEPEMDFICHGSFFLDCLLCRLPSVSIVFGSSIFSLKKKTNVKPTNMHLISCLPQKIPYAHRFQCTPHATAHSNDEP